MSAESEPGLKLDEIDRSILVGPLGRRTLRLDLVPTYSGPLTLQGDGGLGNDYEEQDLLGHVDDVIKFIGDQLMSDNFMLCTSGGVIVDEIPEYGEMPFGMPMVIVILENWPEHNLRARYQLALIGEVRARFCTKTKKMDPHDFHDRFDEMNRIMCRAEMKAAEFRSWLGGGGDSQSKAA